MPRANRYHLPGLIWHVTHRCHERQFLFRFRRDRDRYRHWLYEARKRYGLCLLNYNLTSNHVHLLIHDAGRPCVIERSMQLVEGRIAQEYNNRKNRCGAFWQDRYHATAVQSGRHLRNCFTYIDLNMVRAGKVKHPEEWPSCGFQEIQQPRQRYVLLDLERAARVLGLSDQQELAQWQQMAIADSLQRPIQREPAWSEAVAVGYPDYLETVAQRLGNAARFKTVQPTKEEVSCLKEIGSAYIGNT